MLRWRLLLGALFIAALAGLCWLDAYGVAGVPPGGWLFPLALLVSVAATEEMLALLGSRPSEAQPIREIVHFGGVAIMLGSAVSVYAPRDFGFGPPAALAFAAVLAAIVVEILRFEPGARPIARLASTFFIWIYVPVLLSCVVQLRLILRTYGWHDHDRGMFALVSMIAAVKMGDTGAYTVGRLIGRRKMAPQLSPGKTWEGAVGAILFAGFTSWAIFALGYR